MQLSALISDYSLHHLDHLAPLCHFLEIPLLVTDVLVKEIGEKCYPGLVIHELSTQSIEDYDGIISCLPRQLLDPLLFLSEEMSGKKLLRIWCPHGNSDKGHIAPLMEGLKSESLVLVYGQKMLDFIEEKNGALSNYLVVGNYRYHHYLHFKSFYDSWVDKEIPEEKNLLYAPTWNDAEGSCSLTSALPFLSEEVFVKPHPNTLFQFPHLIDNLKNKHNHLYFLESHIPIYPLLERAKAYIGDMSSIGYDYLAFNRPMFFFNPQRREDRDKGLYLHRCGEEMPTSLLNHQEHLQEIRQRVYDYTFSRVDPTSLKSELLKKIRSL